MAELQSSPEVQKWLGHIAAYNQEFKKWEGVTKKIIKKYRDAFNNNGTTGTNPKQFNILWSNVQTLMPAVYAKLPLADVSRRFADNDPVGRVASTLLERALNFEIEHYPDYRSAMRNAVEDRFLGGRGVAWVRYDPHVREQDIPEDGLQITEDVDDEDEPAESPVEGPAEPVEPGEVPEEIEYECAPTDYVHWKDFGHTVARTWEEVTAVWRWVYLDRAAVEERFGPEIAARISYDASPELVTSRYGQGNRTEDKAKIAEIWDRVSEEAIWLSESSPELLDRRKDPLGLEGFFPCAKPLYATTTTDSLVPVPDFVIYQDQAADLDILTDRIDGFVRALRMRGVYDASQPALQRLLTEGDNNTLIPVDKWMAFSEKGGLKGAIDLLPLDVLSQALLDAYAAQQNIKAQIYELTGISDIVRGVSQANETATAQQIKGQYAGLRLGSMQESVALFASELVRLKAQVMCAKFQPETILSYAAADQLSDEDKALIPRALELLKNKPLRTFRIEVAADSLVQIDEEARKKERTEFLMAFAGFMKEAVPAGQQIPQIAPMMMEVLKFGVSAFKGAKPIEGAIDAGLDELKKLAADAANAPKPPSPEEIKAQARAQADAQIEYIRGQTEIMLQRAKFEHEAQLAMLEQHTSEAYDRWKAELDTATKIIVALIGQQAQPSTVDEDGEETPGAMPFGIELASQIDTIMDGITGPEGMNAPL